MPSLRHPRLKLHALLTLLLVASVGVPCFATGCADDKDKSKKPGSLSIDDLDRLLEAGPATSDAAPPPDAGTATAARVGWLRCQGGCSAKPGTPLECESSTCTGDCDGECATETPVRCDGVCDGTCNGTPISGDVCRGSCTGTCKQLATPRSCPGLCTGRCEGVCVLPAGEVICNGTCSGPSKPM